jgi:hypothetical protein
MSLLRLFRKFRSAPRDYTAQATDLFARFVQRHALTFHAVPDAPIEVLWELPIQQGLTVPITLGLQNGDELNFGVPGFWSYFFPFPTVSAGFERMLDAWLDGQARIVKGDFMTGRRLQFRAGQEWTTFYTAWGNDAWTHPTDVLQNTLLPVTPDSRA